VQVLVSGATGFVGRHLVERLRARGDDIVAVTRDAAKAQRVLGEGVRAVSWQDDELRDAVGLSQALVNLAGEMIFGRRWSAAQKQRILGSRVEATERLVAAIAPDGPKPAVLVSGSAIGYYGAHGDEELDEDTPPADDFLADVCKRWEGAALKAEEAGVRTVLVRTGIVLGRDGGALKQMALPFRLFVGGTVGSGRQWFSWIHIDDLTGIILHAIDSESLRGPVNATAPEPKTNADFSKALGRALGRPSWLPVPAFALRLLIGEGANFILTGQRVLPKRALASGYSFTYPTADEALADLYR
jgi:uncharacterized protein (TIGR01777 family)